MMKTKILTLFVILTVLALGCQQNIGGQRDDYGCLTGAGYSYNQDIGACAREWELDEEQYIKAAKIAVDYIQSKEGLTVDEIISARCPGCFLVKLTDKDQNKIEVNLNDWKVLEENKLTEEEARKIAQESDCIKEGPLNDDIQYNEQTKTWWIGLNTTKEGCMPACVVLEQKREAEINWRCTGLMVPDEVNSFKDCVNKGNPVMESYPRQCAHEGKTFVEEI